jgi:ABC-type transport system involved in cytochrome c biogenesis permease component
MSFLPIVERELRVASRRKSTFRIRDWTALFAMGVTFLFLIFAALSQSRGSGRMMFRILTGFAAALSLVTGVLLTSDCLSVEKREGTLGLLFLSNLKGYDVVFGKFAARSLNAFYGLLALLPILAISLLLGGLTGGEFWRAALALVNGLFFAMTAGICVSSLAVDSRTALSGTIFLLVLFVGGLPTLVAVNSWVTLPRAILWFQRFSPSAPFIYANEMRYLASPNLYWSALAASHLVGWLFLLSASWLLPQSWQQRFGGAMGANAFFSRRSNPKKRAWLRARLLPRNPILWLLGDEPVMQIAVWCLVGLWAAILLTLCLGLTMGQLRPSSSLGFYWCAKAVAFIFKMLLAAQACRFFAESRRNGALELLGTTPLHSRDLVHGQWLALRRIFLVPLLVLVGLNFLPMALSVYRSMATASLPDIGAVVLGVLGGFAQSGWFAVQTFADVLAVCWFGMWLGLSAKKPDLATIWTILFVLVLPAPFWVADIVVDLVLVIWGATALQQDFRLVLSRQLAGPAMQPQLLRPVPNAPPVIRA